MSKRELVQVASRAFSLYLFVWAIDATTYLPERLYMLSSDLNDKSAIVGLNHWANYHLILTATTFVRVVALFVAATVFWRCGPGVQSLFSLKESDQT
jgi:hypothetical protein